MRSISLLTIALLCISITISAQDDYVQSDDFRVELSKPHRVIDAKSKLYLTGEDYIVAIKTLKNGDFHIQSFDKGSLDQIAVSVVDDMEKKADIESFWELNDRFWVFYSLYDSKKKTERLFAWEIDPEKAKMMGSPTLMVSVNGKLSGTRVQTGAYKFKVTNKFRFETSKSGEYIMVRYRLLPETKNDDKSHDRVGMKVFNSELEEQWGVEKEMERTEAEMNFMDYTVDSEGNAYILAQIFASASDRKDSERGDEAFDGYIELIKLMSGSGEIERTKLELESDRIIESVALWEKDENELVIGGYYNNPGSYSVHGMYVLHVSKDDGAYTQNYHAIPKEVLNAFSTKSEKKKNEKNAKKGREGENKLVFDKLFVDEEGNIILVGEEFWVTSRTTTSSSGSTRTTYYYHYGDILAAKINTEGEMDWLVKVPKIQNGGASQGGMSYTTLFNSDALYLLYIDNEKNFTLSPHETPEAHQDGQGGFMTSAKINSETGELSKEHLFNMRDVNGVEVYQFTTSRVVNISDDTIAVEVYKKKKEDIWIRVGLN